MVITRCPTCGGQETVSKPPWVAGDQETWSSGNAWDLYPCPTCDGKGYLAIEEEKS
jgi:hypothetical protein